MANAEMVKTITSAVAKKTLMSEIAISDIWQEKTVKLMERFKSLEKLKDQDTFEKYEILNKQVSKQSSSLDKFRIAQCRPMTIFQKDIKKMTDKARSPLESAKEKLKKEMAIYLTSVAEKRQAEEAEQAQKAAEAEIARQEEIAREEKKNTDAEIARQEEIAAQQRLIDEQEDLNPFSEKNLQLQARVERDEKLKKEAQLQIDGMKERAKTQALQVANGVTPKTKEVDKSFSAQVTNWEFEIEDPKKVPRAFLMPDEKKIRFFIKTNKASAEILGVRIWSEILVRSR